MLESFQVAYLGKIDVYSRKIVESIDLKAGRYFTDFGQGFYVTSNYEQAEKWAINKFKDNMANFNGIKPSIVKFTIDTVVLESCNGLIHRSPSDKWAEFVYNCRKEGLGNKLFHEYDYVCGALADGKITPLMKQLMRGDLQFNEFHQHIKPRATENQLSFHKPQALRCIQGMEVLTIERLNSIR